MDNEDKELIKFRQYTDKYAELVNPDAARWFHVPNGGARNAKVGAKLKRMGTRAGIHDVIFMSPRILNGISYTSFVADMKWGRNKLTTEQEEWADWFTAQGAYFVVTYSAEDLFRTFVYYLTGKVHTDEDLVTYTI